MAALLAVTAALTAGCGSGGGASGSSGTSGPGTGPGSTDPGAASSGGPDPAGPNAGNACARAVAARSAPVSLYDAFTRELASLTGDAKAARVDKLFADVAAHGGTPLEDPATGRTIFLARGAANWSVTTSVDGFDPAKVRPLAAVAGTDLFALDTTISRGASFQYKLQSGSTLFEDRAARTVVWDGTKHPLFVPGEFYAVGHASDWPKDRGRLVRHGKVHSSKLANDRDVFVYLPARYEDGSCPKLPSVLFQDANEALTLGDFAHAADLAYADRPDLSVVLVFVSNAGSESGRTAEFSIDDASKGDDYLDFLVSELWPNVTSGGYRLCGNVNARGIAGASLGGLISTYAAFQKPGQWGWVGAQSASYEWNGGAMIARATASPKVSARFYLDSGCPDDECAAVDQMATVLADKAYDYVRITSPGAAHDWPFWSQRLGGMLTYFRNGKTDCD